MTFLAGLAGAIESLDHLIECPGKIESSDEPIDTDVEHADVFGYLQTQINATRVFDKIPEHLYRVLLRSLFMLPLFGLK